jgi:AAA15 family ATPase/GTPase
MIESLKIENFKSIRNLSITPGRVNIFIGEPSSGKSNIIEAISLLSKRSVPLRELVRMKEADHLFTNNDLEKTIRIETNLAKFSLTYLNGQYIVSIVDFKSISEMNQLKTELGTIQVSRDYSQENEIYNRKYVNPFIKKDTFEFDLVHFDPFINLNEYLSQSILYYKYKPLTQFTDKSTLRLNAPFGDNLPQIILTRGKLKSILSDILLEYGLKLGINPNDNSLKFFREIDNIVYEFPLVSLSDTLIRLLFYITAMHTENSVLLFEEPESHIFPFYNKYFGEKIALDEKNQYFIATHNFPFVSSILQKTNPNDLRIYITESTPFETKLISISQDKFEEIYEDRDNFFLNLNRYKDVL